MRRPARRDLYSYKNFIFWENLCKVLPVSLHSGMEFWRLLVYPSSVFHELSYSWRTNTSVISFFLFRCSTCWCVNIFPKSALWNYSIFSPWLCRGLLATGGRFSGDSREDCRIRVVFAQIRPTDRRGAAVWANPGAVQWKAPRPSPGPGCLSGPIWIRPWMGNLSTHLFF